MAQPFSYRYPLVEGQGNFGSPDDPKSRSRRCATPSRKLTQVAEPAARRTRPGHGGLDANFDGTLQEPTGCRRACRTCCSTAPPASPSAWPPTFRRTTCAKWRPPASACSRNRTATVRDLLRAHPGSGLSDRGGDHHPEGRAAAKSTRPATAASAPAPSTRARTSNIVITALPHQVSPAKIMRTDRRPDARQEAADARGPARRIRSREPDPPGAGAALATGSTPTS